MEGRAVEDRLRLAAGVGRASEHPLALAIVAAAKDRDIDVPEVSDFDSPTGKGAVGTVDGKRIFLGGAVYLTENGHAMSAAAERAKELREEGAKAILEAVDRRVGGMPAIAALKKANTTG